MIRILLAILHLALCFQLSAQQRLRPDYRPLQGLSISLGSDTLHGTGFISSDLGRSVFVYGAGTGTDGSLGDELLGIVTKVISASKIRINKVASVAALNAKGGIGYDNTTLLISNVGSNKALYLSPGHYYFASTAILNSTSNFRISSDGQAIIYFRSCNPNSYITGTQPISDWIKLQSCSDITIKDLKFVNVSQAQSRPNTNEEGAWWSALNGEEVAYNRHFNSRANTGSVLACFDSQNITVENCSAWHVGCLIKTSGSCSGGRILNNTILGYAITGIFPAENYIVSGNLIDNTEAPPLGAEDINQRGTSHAAYVASGFDNVQFFNNNIKGCREYAFQINTSSGKPNRAIKIEGNIFKDCFGSCYFAGNSNPQTIDFENNTVIGCGPLVVDATNAVMRLANNVFTCEYQYIQSWNSAVVVNKCQSFTSDGDLYSCFNRTGQSSGVQVSTHIASAAKVLFQNCTFQNSSRSVQTLLGHNEFTGSITVRNCRIEAMLYFGSQLSGSTGPGSLAKFHVTENDFWVTNDNAIGVKYGAEISGNRFYRNANLTQIGVYLLSGSDDVMVTNNHFIYIGNDGSLFTLYGSDSGNRVIFTQNTIKGPSEINLNGGALKLRAGNFYIDDGSID